MQSQLRTILATIFLSIGLFSATGASATVITMTFEGLGDFEYVRNFYNGGLGSKGSGPGANYGIAFPGDTNTYLNAYLNQGTRGARFWGEPTPNTALSFQQSGAWMNVASGFTDSLSFYYANPNGNSTISIYSEINGGGQRLATLFLPQTAYTGQDGHIFPMSFVSLGFSGVAKSVDFLSMAHRGYIDDLSINTVAAVVPLPATAWLLGSGLLGLIGVARRKAA